MINQVNGSARLLDTSSTLNHDQKQNKTQQNPPATRCKTPRRQETTLALCALSTDLFLSVQIIAKIGMPPLVPPSLAPVLCGLAAGGFPVGPLAGVPPGGAAGAGATCGVDRSRPC